MSWIITGGTGLLGTYLIRDLLSRGVPLAIVCRSRRMLTATQRIEGILQFWERQGVTGLARPKILEGDLREPGLGLSPTDRDWVARHGTGLIHNAASLTFYAKDRSGEPYLTNVAGTQHMLQLCAETGLRNIQHVSTAYICGLRLGRILESEFDCGQTPGNDYEASKLESERLVREARGIDSLTIHRPAIIVGDSQTGFTSTYHGLYVPLKLIVSSLDQIVPRGVDREELQRLANSGGERLMSVLGLNGHERKHLVPVDWVSAVMSHIICEPGLHGQTYHLTPRQPVTVRQIQQAATDTYIPAVRQYQARKSVAGNWDQFEHFFQGGMQSYQSYFRDDPQFDQTHTLRAAPHLPCPDVNDAMLCRLLEAAVKSGFREPVHYQPTSNQSLESHREALARRLDIPVTLLGDGTDLRADLGLEDDDIEALLPTPPISTGDQQGPQVLDHRLRTVGDLLKHL